MDFDVTRDQWVERFAMHLSQLEVGAVPDDFLDLAARRWESRGQVAPETAADEEFGQRLSASAVASVDFQNTLGLGDESRFERTERIPVERDPGGRRIRSRQRRVDRPLRRPRPGARPDHQGRRSAPLGRASSPSSSAGA